MPGYAPPQGGDGGGGGTDELLQRAAQLAEMALQNEPDRMRSQAISKALNTLYSILASAQKEEETAMGVTAQHKGMARAYGA